MDGRSLVDASGDRSFEKFAVRIGAGQTFDALFMWTDVDNWWTVTDSDGAQVPGDTGNPNSRPVIPTAASSTRSPTATPSKK
jgi:hypothetical protein